MLNTVVLFTPPNHRIACSTTCGHLRPIVANTVSTKSMLAHLLSTINHCFEIIRVFGHLYFRCYTTWSFGYIEFEMSIWSKISRSTRQSGVFRFIWPFYQVADFFLGRPNDSISFFVLFRLPSLVFAVILTLLKVYYRILKIV